MILNVNKQADDYVIRFGIRAYLFALPFLVIIIGICILLWFINIVYFYFTVSTSSLGVAFWLYYFIRMRLIVSGKSIEARLPFQKKRKFDLERIRYINKRLGRVYFVFNDNTFLTAYFYMDNIKRLVGDANNGLGER